MKIIFGRAVLCQPFCHHAVFVEKQISPICLPLCLQIRFVHRSTVFVRDVQNDGTGFDRGAVQPIRGPVLKKCKKADGVYRLSWEKNGEVLESGWFC